MPELMKILRPMYLPPGGVWFYTVSETKCSFESAQSLDDLECQVRRHLEANKLPVPPELRSVIEDWMCRRLPEGLCSGDDSLPKHERPPQFFEIVEATEKYFRGSKLQYVAQTVADARMHRCWPCPMNSMRLCTSCDGLRTLARKFVGGRRTIYDARVGVCKVLRLPINAVVHVGGIKAEDAMPESCWVRDG